MTVVDLGRLTLTGNSATVEMATPAWILDGVRLLHGTGAVRGQDRVLPGAAGVRTFPRRSTLTQLTLTLKLNGDFNEAGVRQSDPCSTVVSHLDYLIGQLVNSPVVGQIAPVRAAVLHHPVTGASFRTGYVRVVEITPRAEAQAGSSVWPCDFVVELPFGRLT